MDISRGIYYDKFPRRAYKLALLGMTDLEMADFFEIHLETFQLWKSQKPEFAKAILRGKDKADSKVVQSLYRRAKGYTYTETKKSEGVSSKGEKFDNETVIDKHVPADVKAIVFWLTNRQKARWANTSKSEVTVNKKMVLDLDKLTPEQEKLVKSIALKQITNLHGISSN